MAHDTHPHSKKVQRRLSRVEHDSAYKLRQLRSQRDAENGKNGVDHDSDSNTLIVTESEGDLFQDLPDDCVLIHACNCMGSWGAGIASEFKRRYPQAFKIYHDHCHNSTPAQLIGTALLIPPSETVDTEAGVENTWIGCLFTSRRFGKARDGPKSILENTSTAMIDLMAQISERQDEAVIGEIRMCKINAGLFNVPWEDTKGVVEEIEVENDDMPRVVKVFCRDTERE